MAVGAVIWAFLKQMPLLRLGPEVITPIGKNQDKTRPNSLRRGTCHHERHGNHPPRQIFANIGWVLEIPVGATGDDAAVREI